MTFGAFLKVVRPKNIIPKYLGYYFLSNEYRRTISSISEGANINNIRNEHIDDLLISIVYNDTQKMRSKILDKVYGILKRKKQQLTEYDQLIKSRFVEMFGDICNGKSNYPTVKLSEVIIPKIERAKKDFNSDDEIKYVDISSVDNEENIIIGYSDYLMKDAPSRAQQHVRKRHLISTWINLNNVAKVSDDYSNIVASSGFCVLKLQSWPNFLLLWLYAVIWLTILLH